MIKEEQTLELIACLVQAEINLEISQFTKINRLSNSISMHLAEKREKLPYHINIIDLLGANENAHSRILKHLLLQYSTNRFEILESLLKYIAKINPNFNLDVESPVITTEYERIDILVRDKTYAIIFENKIHNAIDQEAQLSRYIDKVNAMGYKKKQIYILYLPRDDGKIPRDNSWGGYKNEFQERYMRLTYRNHILPWLQNVLLPNIRIKDVYLKSCVEQYIDYLEGLFSLRKIQIIMNKELKKTISDTLGLGTSPENDYSILSEKIEEINHLRDQLAFIQVEVEKDCWNKWLRQLIIDFPNLELVDHMEDRSYPKIGVKLSWNDIDFCVLIEKEVNSNSIYYGIGRHYASENLDENLQKFLAPLLDGFKSSPWWYGWKYTSFENGYKRLYAYIQAVCKYIQS